MATQVKIPSAPEFPARNTGRSEEIALIAKALGHPARIQIVDLLLNKETCIGHDIVEEIGLAQSTVSEHLRILKAAGIITGEIEHPRVCYTLNPDRFEPLAALLSEIFERQGRHETANFPC